jgi:DNA sulfur modification protein DndE
LVIKPFNRIRISEDSTNRLKTLKQRTGLTPNILCRIALCFSLEKGHVTTQFIKIDENGQEFNRFTLTGEYDSYFLALIKQRCLEDGLDPENEFFNQFKLHLNNGIISIYGRVKNLSDLVNLL